MTETPPEPLVSVHHDGGVATVLLERPKVNALSIALLDELSAVLEALHREPPGALVLSGGRRLFAAGAEISELAVADRAPALIAALARASRLLAELPRVTFAAVNGVAFGGGLELALACDLRLVARDVRLALPEIHLGIFPGGGGTQRLARLVGVARAKELIFTGREVHAEEALAIGLADQVHEPDQLLAAAQSFAAQFARGPLVALQLAKRAIDTGLDLGIEDGLALERELFARALSSEDARIGMASFFANGPGHAEFSGK